ncbi:hypothetical protein [Streptomyces sp. enrichment culture]|uniref:hypothetical protein n=1 Tax=Streptomyces sp. enrichment culture TaxID=1795815 RepID=UPI003F5469C9
MALRRDAGEEQIDHAIQEGRRAFGQQADDHAGVIKNSRAWTEYQEVGDRAVSSCTASLSLRMSLVR